MACYTLSDCVLKNLNNCDKYITDLVLVFTNSQNNLKIILDKDNKIMDLYKIAAQTNYDASYWLTLMSHKVQKFETINVDTLSISDSEELFLKVCSKTKNQQKLIVDSHQNWRNFNYKTTNVIEYNNIPLTILDKDDAIFELNQQTQQTIIFANNSILATQNSSIYEVNNNHNEK